MRLILPLLLLTVLAPAAQARPKAHVSLVDTKTGKVTNLRASPSRDIFYTSPVWAADGRTAYVTRMSHTYLGAKVLALDTRKRSAKTVTSVPGTNSLELSPGADRIAYATDGFKASVLVRPLAGGPTIGHQFEGRVTDLCWSPDGRKVAVGTIMTKDGYGPAQVTVLDAATMAPILSAETGYPVFDDDSWDADSSRLYFRSYGHQVDFNELYLDSGEIDRVEESGEDTDAHAVSPRGDRVALVTRTSVRVFPTDETYRAPRRTHLGAIDYSPAGGAFAYAYTTDGKAIGPATLISRSVETGRQLAHIPIGAGEPTALAYAPDGRRVLAVVSLQQVDQ